MMLTSGAAPPIGVKLSCIASTEPVEVPVVDDANSPEVASAESRLLALEVAADLGRRCLLTDPHRIELVVAVRLEDHRDERDREPQHEHRAEHREALFDVAGHLPEHPRERERDREQHPDLEQVRDRRSGSRTGAQEFALYGPPPFSPISLIASWLAIGPPGSVCVWPDTVVTAFDAWKFCTTPWLTSTSANTNASGNRTRVVVRTRSTQKLPSVCVRRRTRPRINATATAAPAAADTKLCTARPAICVRYDIVDSPE